MKNTVKIDSKNCKMVAHRGLSGLELENTAAAFVAAGNREKYYGIETDVHPTKDGKFVIIHDFDLKRLAGLDIAVESTDLDSLQQIVLNNVFGPAARKDYRLPCLEDYMEICEKYGKHPVLELKSDMSKEMLVKMIDLIKSFGMLENTIFISFCDTVLVKLRELLPDQPMMFLACECNDRIVDFLEKYHFGLDIMYPALSEDQIKMLKSKGILVNIWTCDNKEDAERYISYGVDFITTNILE